MQSRGVAGLSERREIVRDGSVSNMSFFLSTHVIADNLIPALMKAAIP
jgi:hypothetical protein